VRSSRQIQRRCTEDLAFRVLVGPNRTLTKLQDEVDQILREAAETDQAGDRQHGQARGDELPAELASPSGRLDRLRQAKLRLEAEAAERQRRYHQRVPSWRPRPAPAAGSPGPTSSPAAGMRHPTQGGRQHHRPRQPLPAHQKRHRAGL
jgi:hypothetical protein